jgi:hypothetical protein
MILREVKAEIIELITNLTFVRNLSLTMMIAIASLYGLAELQSQRLLRRPKGYTFGYTAIFRHIEDTEF